MRIVLSTIGWLRRDAVLEGSPRCLADNDSHLIGRGWGVGYAQRARRVVFSPGVWTCRVGGWIRGSERGFGGDHGPVRVGGVVCARRGGEGGSERQCRAAAGYRV